MHYSHNPVTGDVGQVYKDGDVEQVFIQMEM